MPVPPGAPRVRLRVSVFRNVLELNAYTARRKLWPREELVYALTECHPGKVPSVRIYLSRDQISPGIVAHECGHALFFVARCIDKMRPIGARVVKRFKNNNNMNAAVEEEWFCHSMQYMVSNIIKRLSEVL